MKERTATVELKTPEPVEFNYENISVKKDDTPLPIDTEKNFRDSIKDGGRYWIKTGSLVHHREMPGITMVVDQIVKKPVKVRQGDDIKEKMWIVGVDCHWVNKDGVYSSGRFLTMELSPKKD